jgi:small subunit ribosomal protein S6
MTCYESIFIVRSEATTQDVVKITTDSVKIVENAGSTLVKKEYWGLRQLAYPIQKNRRGHYVLLGIDGSTREMLKDLEHLYKTNELVIRHLTIKVDKIDVEPSIIMRASDDKTEAQR